MKLPTRLGPANEDSHSSPHQRGFVVRSLNGSAAAFIQNNQAFLAMAKERSEPLQKTLQLFDEKVQAIEANAPLRSPSLGQPIDGACRDAPGL